MLLTSLDDVKVLGVNIAVLGKVEVLLRNEYALCGDRVSAYPCMQQAAAQTCIFAMAMARAGNILTAEEVPMIQTVSAGSTKCHRGTRG
jgi:hypothetical protein